MTNKEEAFRFSVLQRNGSFTEHPQLEAEFDDIVAEFIRLGIIEYDPEKDTVRWIGPDPASPEFAKLMEQLQLDDDGGR
jgi:hypothetical protein